MGEGGRGLSAVESALSRRARAALDAGRGPGADASSGDAAQGPSPGLLDSLRHHLLAGETHYPDRPGMVELRRLVGLALPAIGYSARDPDGVLITAGEGESLFVTLLALGRGTEVRFPGGRSDRHDALLAWMGIGGTDPHAAGPAPASRVEIVGDRLFRDHADTPLPASPETVASGPAARAEPVVVGSLYGLDAMRPFRLGFVAAAPEILSGITKWKQASSICSPAPSQRAALWALGVRP